jgi:hypothetical protein
VRERGGTCDTAERAAPTRGNDLCRLSDDVRQVMEVVAAELALVSISISISTVSRRGSEKR